MVDGLVVVLPSFGFALILGPRGHHAEAVSCLSLLVPMSAARTRLSSSSRHPSLFDRRRLMFQVHDDAASSAGAAGASAGAASPPSAGAASFLASGAVSPSGVVAAAASTASVFCSAAGWK